MYVLPRKIMLMFMNIKPLNSLSVSFGRYLYPLIENHIRVLNGLMINSTLGLLESLGLQ